MSVAETARLPGDDVKLTDMVFPLYSGGTVCVARVVADLKANMPDGSAI